MSTITRITARHLPVSEPVRSHIQDRIDRLGHFFQAVNGCNVTLDGPGAHHGRGDHSVVVEIAVPRRRIVVSHRSDVSLEAAVKDAFDAAERQLEDYARRLRSLRAASQGSRSAVDSRHLQIQEVPPSPSRSARGR